MQSQLKLNWAKDNNKDKGKIEQMDKRTTQFTTFLDHQSRMRRCGLLALLGDRFYRPRSRWLSTSHFTSITDLGAPIASLAKREWRPTRCSPVTEKGSESRCTWTTPS